MPQKNSLRKTDVKYSLVTWLTLSWFSHDQDHRCLKSETYALFKGRQQVQFQLCNCTVVFWDYPQCSLQGWWQGKKQKQELDVAISSFPSCSGCKLLTGQKCRGVQGKCTSWYPLILSTALHLQIFLSAKHVLSFSPVLHPACIVYRNLGWEKDYSGEIMLQLFPHSSGFSVPF